MKLVTTKEVTKIKSLPKISKIDTLARSLILNAFSSMKKGCLELQTPEGNLYKFGSHGEAKPALLKVQSNRFWLRSVLFGDIGFAESYLDGEWSTPDLKGLISWFISNNKNSPVLEGSKNRAIWANLLGLANRFLHSLKPNDIKGSKSNIEKHYDLSNELFELFLDESMTYSCAKFLDAKDTLEIAQKQKIDSLCQKLRLKPNDKLLEIGSGWGAFAIHAAQNYGCHVTTVTISHQQYAYVKNKVEKLGLSNRINIILQDYREIKGQFDKIVSVEMIEAVGEKYLDTFFSNVHRLLKDNGIVAMQMIICPDNLYSILNNNVDFIQKHIFPGGQLPSLARVIQAINGTGNLGIFEIEDLASSYVMTLDSWYQRFNSKLNNVRALGFSDKFIRKWNYYLQYCSAGFTMRNVTVVQVVMSRPNNLNLNQSVQRSILSIQNGGAQWM